MVIIVVVVDIIILSFAPGSEMESIIPFLIYSMPAILAFPSIDLVQNFKLNYPSYIAK